MWFWLSGGRRYEQAGVMSPRATRPKRDDQERQQTSTWFEFSRRTFNIMDKTGCLNSRTGARIPRSSRTPFIIIPPRLSILKATPLQRTRIRKDTYGFMVVSGRCLMFWYWDPALGKGLISTQPEPQETAENPRNIVANAALGAGHWHLATSLLGEDLCPLAFLACPYQSPLKCRY